jgi:hypothetical protein
VKPRFGAYVSKESDRYCVPSRASTNEHRLPALPRPTTSPPHNSRSDYLNHFTAPEQRVEFSRRAFLSYDASGRAIVVDSTRTNDLKGVTSHARSTREAPAQAELRPTCAGAPKPWAGPFGRQRTTLNTYSCLATISLSLRDKSHPASKIRMK